MAIAIICENNPTIQKNLSLILKTFNFESITPISLEEAITVLETTDDISIVIVNETFADQKPHNNRIIQYITNLPMYRRRDIMLIITGQNMKTLDRLLAFAKGADLIVNTQDINNFLSFFKRSYSEHQAIYRQYKELLNR
jgi:CheY-like chemotaxis protein